MISAIKACNIAKDVNSKNVYEYLKTIEDKIKKTAEDGFFFTYITAKILEIEKDYLVHQLRQAGYIVEVQENPSLKIYRFLISWKIS